MSNLFKSLVVFFLLMLVLPRASAQTATKLNPGDAVTLSFTADGTAPFTAQWKKNGVALNGETNPTLVLTNYSSTKDGTYTVVVSNSAGSVESDGVVLAQIILKPSNTKIVVTVGLPIKP